MSQRHVLLEQALCRGKVHWGSGNIHYFNSIQTANEFAVSFQKPGEPGRGPLGFINKRDAYCGRFLQPKERSGNGLDKAGCTAHSVRLHLQQREEVVSRFFALDEFLIVEMRQNVIEGNQSAPDLQRRFQAAALRIAPVDHAVNLLTVQVINEAAFCAWQLRDVTEFRGLTEKAGGNAATLPLHGFDKLATEKIPRMNGDHVDERRLAVCVSSADKRFQCSMAHRSITQSSACCSFSILLRREWSEADAYMRKPACALACMWPGR